VSCGKATRTDGPDGGDIGDAGAANPSHGGAEGSRGGSSGAGAGGASTAGNQGKGGGATAGTGSNTGEAGMGASAGAGSTGNPDSSSVNLEGSPIYTRVQRLTNTQWQRAVNDVLRLRTPANLTESFALPISGTTDFTNNEKVLFVDSRAASEFELATEAAASLATSSAEALAALYPGSDREGFVRTFGRRAFRRPLTPEQEARYQAVFALGEQLYGAGFANGASFVIRAMLESPSFLYRSELGAAGAPLDGFELASKLSFWLLGTTPSDALLDAAAKGALDGADALEKTAREMLDQPAAVDVLRDFHGQLHHLDRYASVSKVGVPEYSDALNAELGEASYRFFDEVFRQGAGLRAILTSPRAFVGPGLAPLYGLTPAPSALEAQNLDPSRIGYFMQVPFLLLYGINRKADALARGEALETDVLCARPTAPEQLGLALENFDGMGQERDPGQPSSSARSYPFAEGKKSFASALELMKTLADSRQAQVCYAKKLSSYALQRDIVESDVPLLDRLTSAGGELFIKEVIVSLVRDPAFRVRQDGTP
jgi:hypothetical protein